MITRSNRNRKNELNRFASASRGIVITAIAAAMLNPSVYAQTNSSSGINRSSAQKEAQSPKRNQTTAGARTQVIAGSRAQTGGTSGNRASSTNNKATSAAKSRAMQSAAERRAAARRQTSQAPVKVIIRGTREDARLARQQGLQSLQSANAAVAAQNAAEAEAAQNAAAAQAQNAAVVANAQNGFQNPYYGYGYGYLPPFVNANSPYAGTPVVPYGSVQTVAPVLQGATPFGAPTVNFPPFYSSYTPGVFSSYTTFGY